jgi:CBS domain containing-hemolysin-like protein
MLREAGRGCNRAADRAAVVTVARAPAGVPAPHLGIFAEMSGIEVVDIAHAIQLAVAPVFLLSGVGVVLGVLTARLARIVDRARAVEDRLRNEPAHDTPRVHQQLRVLARRARLINIAITLITITALLVALVIALLFASTFAPMSLATPIAVLFVASMVSLVVALVAFLLEVRIAIAVLRIGSW